ncbi:MAG: arginase family protein [Deltaproteobacteria bacterium]|nr:arginase family protein [Deltaproteobacteria bacterium]
MLRSTASLSVDEALDELALYLKPPGQGIFSVSTGKRELLERTERYLGGPIPEWRAHLDALSQRPAVVLLGVPSDAGAGIMRGAAYGPMAIREGLGHAPVLDLGDVFTVPHFIDDAMLSDAQRWRSQDAMYPRAEPGYRRALPVSPIDLTARVFDLVQRVSPRVRIHLLGGDHTVSYGAMLGLFSRPGARNQDVGIVHFDAHTDLLEERLGVRFCFATWARYANDLIGRDRRLIQIGVRASAKDRSHWESVADVRQVWAPEARELAPGALAELVIGHLRGRGVRRVYISNDLDGTDAAWAAACGTPEPNGLSPPAVLTVIGAVSAAFEVIGADMVELAPGLSLSPEKSKISVETAVAYTQAQLRALGARGVGGVGGVG